MSAPEGYTLKEVVEMRLGQQDAALQRIERSMYDLGTKVDNLNENVHKGAIETAVQKGRERVVNILIAGACSAIGALLVGLVLLNFGGRR